MIHALEKRQLADLFGVDPRTIERWHSKGMPRNEDGTYDGTCCVAWLLRYRTGNGLDLSAERAALAKAQRERVEMQNAVSRSELGVVSEVAEWYGSHVDRCTARLQQVPDTLGQLCSPAVARVIVPECRRLIHEAQSELAADEYVAPGHA